MYIINSKDKRKKIKSSIAIALYVAFMVIAAILFHKFVDRDSLQMITENSGYLGLVIYFLIEVVYVTFTPLLNSAILIISGYLFGGHTGFIINFTATTFGLFLIVFLVKKYGRPMLKRLVSERFYNKFDHIVQKVGPITLLIVYVLPLTPDDELTYIIAAGPIGIKRFILPIILGTLAKAAYSYIGDKGTEGILIATYARIILLIIGVVMIGTQEYILLRIKRRETYITPVE